MKDKKAIAILLKMLGDRSLNAEKKGAISLLSALSAGLRWLKAK